MKILPKIIKELICLRHSYILEKNKNLMNIDDIILLQPLNLISGLLLIFSIFTLSFNFSTTSSLHSNRFFNISINYILIVIFLSIILFLISLLSFKLNILRNTIVFFYS